MTSNIEYNYFLNGVSEIQHFKGTTEFSEEISGKDMYYQVVKEHPEHDIIFSSFKVDCLYLSHLIYIG